MSNTRLWKIEDHRGRPRALGNVILALMIVSVASCVSMTKVMINEEGKQVVVGTAGWGVVGTPAAVVIQRAQEKNYRDKGYVDLEEFERKEGPKVEERVGLTPPLEGPPVWEVGYSWTYQLGGITKGQHRQEIIGKETVADLPAYVMQSDKKSILYDQELNPIQSRENGTVEFIYTPPRQDYEWPLTVGKTWRAKSKVKTATSKYTIARQVDVKGYGIVRVPAGEFEAFYILTSTAPLIGPNDTAQRLLEVWYSPKVRHHVKRVVYTDKGWIISELTSFHGGSPEEKQR